MTRWLVLVAALLVALVAAPRLVAYLHLAVGQPALAKIRAGERLAREAYERIERSRRAAVAWIGPGSWSADLAALRLHRAYRFGLDTKAARRLAREAEVLLLDALASRPVNANAWYQLAYARTILDRPQAAADALAMAYRSEPYAPEIAVRRLELALLLYDRLPRTTRSAMLEDVRVLRAGDRDRLRNLAVALGRAPVFDWLVQLARNRRS